MRQPSDTELVICIVLGVALAFAGFGEWYERSPPMMPSVADASRMTQPELERRGAEREAFITHLRQHPRPLPLAAVLAVAFGGVSMAIVSVCWLGNRHIK